MNAEIQLYLENHTICEDETCTVTLVRTVDSVIQALLAPLAYVGLSTAKKKVRKSTVRSLRERPTQFLATQLSAQGSYSHEYQACSSRVLQLSKNA